MTKGHVSVLPALAMLNEVSGLHQVTDDPMNRALG